MSSISNILRFFMEITVTTPFNEEYTLRCHVPSEDTSTSFTASLEESAFNSSHASCIVMLVTALVVLTHLLIILSQLFSVIGFGRFISDVKVSSPEYPCPVALILYVALVFMSKVLSYDLEMQKSTQKSHNMHLIVNNDASLFFFS